MGQVIVRNLDDETIRALKARAAMHGNSLEQELRGILAQAAKPGPKERLALADEIRAMTPRKRQSNSTALIREDRER
jgi:plasmid stability protein